MARAKWIVVDIGSSFAGAHRDSAVDVLHVREVGAPAYRHVGVWRTTQANGDTQFACLTCSGPLVAMLSNCVHASAARRAHAAGKIIKEPKP